MAFTRMKLTTFGSNLEAKSRQGKGLHFTRIALGDGLLGNESMVNRIALINERLSVSIDAVMITDEGTQSAVVGNLDNRKMSQGFSYRELALMARDPDTHQEGAYLYDNAGPECEYLGLPEDGMVICEQLKILIKTEETDQITFDASGNPLYITSEDMTLAVRLHEGDPNAHPTKADLDPETGKVVANQMPLMDYAASKHAAAHATTGSDPIAPADIGAAPKSHTHAAKDLPATMPPSAHKHTKSDITNFPSSMPASDVYSWAKAVSKPSYTPSEVGAAPASHSHGSADLPTMPITKGGTGATTAAAALYALLNGSGALAASGLATGDILALGDISAKTGKKVTLADLLTWMKNNGSVQIATGSYVGTGTYGANNPCSLTFPFVPKCIMIPTYCSAGGRSAQMGSLTQGGTGSFGGTTLLVWANTLDGISSAFTAGFGIGFSRVYSGSNNISTKITLYGRLSGKTYQWYTSPPKDFANSDAAQFNQTNTTYLYIAIG